METIEGTVENIIFQSDDKQFCVFRTKCASLGLVTTVYKGPAPFMGEMIRARGEWTQHARFGRQFSVTGYQSLKPGSAEGIIVAHFGKDTLDILGKAPERLAEVSGIGAKKAKSIGEAYNTISDLRELMLFLEENGDYPNQSESLQPDYGY